jgi:hypothetical protein
MSNNEEFQFRQQFMVFKTINRFLKIKKVFFFGKTENDL